jgi:hypothetical protein
MEPTTSAAPSRFELSEPALSAPLQALVDRELGDGEAVVWCAQPRAWRRAQSGLLATAFGIFWTAHAVTFWGFAALHRAADIPGVVFLIGVPHLLVGLAALTTSVRAALAARDTAYVVTSRQVLIVSTWSKALWPFKAHVVSLGPAALHAVDLVQDANGAGDLVLGREPVGNGRRSIAVGFLGIDDVKGAEQRVRALVERARVA